MDGVEGVDATLAGETVRLLTTVRTPATWAASLAARARAASLLTLPVRVATPSWREAWMGSLARAESEEMRVWMAVRRDASVG